MVGCIYKYVCEFYVDIWQVWWNIYVCGFIYVENITVGRMWIYICWKYDCWQDAGSIENVTVVIVVEFEKKWLLERNDKERLKNNILIKW